MNWANFRHRFLYITFIVTILSATSILQRVDSFVPNEPAVNPFNESLHNKKLQEDCKPIQDELDKVRDHLRQIENAVIVDIMVYISLLAGKILIYS